MTAPIAPTFYADPQALGALKSGAQAQDPAALREVAKQFESLFTQMLLKSMREANKGFGDGGLFSSDQTDFYQGMFDNQLATQLSRGEGLGLADMLMRQLAGVGGGGGADRQSWDTAASSGVFDRSSAGSAVGAPGTTGEPTTIAESKQDFIRSLWPHAQQAGRELGVDPHALLAQAALETGWGKSVPCTAAGDCSFNLFGIKATGQWSGATVNVPTLEFEQGVAVRKVERFRAYDSPAASFNDYARLIRDNPRYENALGTGSDVASFASALQNGGYATDPQYARKLTAVANELRRLTGAAGQASALNFRGARPITVGAGV